MHRRICHRELDFYFSSYNLSMKKLTTDSELFCIAQEVFLKQNVIILLGDVQGHTPSVSSQVTKETIFSLR